MIMILNNMSERRNTRQKAVIEQAVSEMGIHRTAEEVYSIVQKNDAGIGLATVYRHLNRMYKDGKVQRLSVSGTYYYDVNSDPHDHFYCTVCGKLMDVPAEYDQSMDRRTAERIGAVMVSHTVMYEGICSNCQKHKEGRT